MLCEAQASRQFDDYVVAEVDDLLVDLVRSAGGAVTVNVAAADGIRQRRLEGIRIGNPAVPADRAMIVEAVRGADEMATAIPSVTLYAAGGASSIAALLADGLDADRPRVLYACENNNFAAEILHGELAKLAPADRLASLDLLDTVIGKMSGVISSAAEMRALGLAPLVAGADRCVLVEEFNRILVSRVRLPGFRRAIRVFEEKDDLLPFEEAKLFGHNAMHALLGYLAERRGLAAMSDIRDAPDLLALGRRAFLEESGAALVAKHGATGDPLFTGDGVAGVRRGPPRPHDQPVARRPGRADHPRPPAQARLGRPVLRDHADRPGAGHRAAHPGARRGRGGRPRPARRDRHRRVGGVGAPVPARPVEGRSRRRPARGMPRPRRAGPRGARAMTFRKTKIVCTLGPTASEVPVLCALLRAGMNVARFNMAHGSVEEHEARAAGCGRRAARPASPWPCSSTSRDPRSAPERSPGAAP